MVINCSSARRKPDSEVGWSVGRSVGLPACLFWLARTSRDIYRVEGALTRG